MAGRSDWLRLARDAFHVEHLDDVLCGAVEDERRDAGFFRATCDDREAGHTARHPRRVDAEIVLVTRARLSRPIADSH